VLKGADGIVFVADSQEKMVDANEESFRNLEENCVENGINLAETPLILQFNKRDLPNVASLEEMNNALNRYNAPFYESVATTGIGVHESLKGITKLVLHSLRERYAGERAASRSASVTAPAVSPGAAKLPSPTEVAPPTQTPPVMAQSTPEAAPPATPVEPIEVSASIEPPDPSAAEPQVPSVAEGGGVETGANVGPAVTGPDPIATTTGEPEIALQDDVQAGVTVAPPVVSEPEAPAASEVEAPAHEWGVAPLAVSQAESEIPSVAEGPLDDGPTMTVQSAVPGGGPFEADDQEIQVLDLGDATGEEDSEMPLSAEPSIPELTPETEIPLPMGVGSLVIEGLLRRADEQSVPTIEPETMEETMPDGHETFADLTREIEQSGEFLDKREPSMAQATDLADPAPLYDTDDPLAIEEPIVPTGVTASLAPDDPLGLGSEEPTPDAAVAAPVLVIEPGTEEVDIPIEVRSEGKARRFHLRLRVSLNPED